MSLYVTGRKLASFSVIWSVKVDIFLFILWWPVGKIWLPEVNSGTSLVTKTS